MTTSTLGLTCPVSASCLLSDSAARRSAPSGTPSSGAAACGHPRRLALQSAAKDHRQAASRRLDGGKCWGDQTLCANLEFGRHHDQALCSEPASQGLYV